MKSASTPLPKTAETLQKPCKLLSPLPPYADGIAFQSWSKLFLIKANQEYGHGDIIYIPPSQRTQLVKPFDPKDVPTEPISEEGLQREYEGAMETLEKRKLSLNLKLLELLDLADAGKGKDPFSVLKAEQPGSMMPDADAVVLTSTKSVGTPVHPAVGITSHADGTSGDMFPVGTPTGHPLGTPMGMDKPGSSSLMGTPINQSSGTPMDLVSLFTSHPPTILDVRMELAKCEHELQIVQRRFDNKFQRRNEKVNHYRREMRKYDDICLAHSKWVSLIKENLDYMDVAAISNCLNFSAMMDTLYHKCNSVSTVDMQTEWDSRWNVASAKYPFKLATWHELRERFFLIHGNYTPQLDKTLSSRFKQKLLQILPPNDNEYTSLFVTLQNDKLKNDISSAEILKAVEDIEAAKSRERTIKQMVSSTQVNGKKANLGGKLPQKRSHDSQKYCDFHHSHMHSNEECKAKKTKTTSNTDPPMGKGKVKPNGKLQTNKGRRFDEVGKLNSEISELRAMVTSLKQKHVDNENKIKVLLSHTGEKFLFYSDHITDQELLLYPTKYLDSGSNRHITPESFVLDNVREVKGNQQVFDATNTPSTIQLEGSMDLQMGGKSLKLENVLYCPQIVDTLISPSSLLMNTEDMIVLTGSHAFYKAAGDTTHHEIARVINGMYYLVPPASLPNLPHAAMMNVLKCLKKGKQPPFNIYKNYQTDRKVALHAPVEWIKLYLDEDDDSLPMVSIQALMVKSTKNPHKQPVRMAQDGSLITKIHHRFAHFNFNLIIDTLKKTGMVGVNNKLISTFEHEVQKLHDMSTMEFCTNCAQGKISQLPIRESTRKATRILEILHTDTFPLPVESPNREKYGTILVDGFTRYTVMYFHHSKSESFPILKQYLKRWEDQHSPLKIGAIRHDNGELKKQFADFCAQQNPPIFNEPSVGYVKELNGLSERTYSLHKNNAITMNLQANLPKSFTKYALMYSVFVKNRICHPDDNKTTPFTMWFGRPPDFHQLRAYGCAITIWKSKEQRSNFYDTRGALGIFLGYQGDHIATAYDLDKCKIQPIYHCIFHENYFPGLTKPHGTTFQGEESDEDYTGPENEMQSMDYTGPGMQLMEEDNFEVVIDNGDIPLDETHPEQTKELDLPPLEEEVETTILPFWDDNTEMETNTAYLSDPEENYDIKISPKTQAILTEWHIKSMIMSKIIAKKSTHKVGHTPSGSDISAQTDVHTLPGPYGTPDVYPPKQSIDASTLPPAPKSRKEALASIYSYYWLEAEKAELNAMARLGVWKEARWNNLRRKILRPKWIYEYKVDKSTNTLLRFKARLVAMGNTQTQGIDYDQTFSPVVKIQSIRILIVIALMLDWEVEQVDIDTAYLNADLTIHNVMATPEGYEKYDDEGFKIVLILLKSIYGLHQSGREWNKTIATYIKEIDFTQSIADPCVFYKTVDGQLISVILLYVDDMIIMAPQKQLIQTIKNQLQKQFTIKDIGEVKHVVGLQLERFDNEIYLGQPKYAQKILQTMNMWDCDTRPIPMSPDWIHADDSPKLNKESEQKYKSCVMMLSYLAQQSRPDIVFAVNTLAQHQTDCREADMKALEYLLRYLKGTWDYGITYSKDGNKIATLVSNDADILDDPLWLPQGYADASYAQEKDRKSRSGHIFFMGGAAVTWYCKRQPVVALSSTEAEYYALSEAVKEALWLRQLLDELGLKINSPTHIHQDNLSTIAIALNPIQHQRVKHMDVKVHFLREHLDKENIKLIYCPTDDMVADSITKAVPRVTHRKFTQLMGLRSLAELQGKILLFTNNRRF